LIKMEILIVVAVNGVCEIFKQTAKKQQPNHRLVA